MAVDDQSEICFSIPRGTLLRKPFFVGFIHRIDFFVMPVSQPGGLILGFALFLLVVYAVCWVLIDRLAYFCWELQIETVACF